MMFETIKDRRRDGATTLRKLQLVQVYLLNILDEICKKHRISYFLTGGTLLGAIRHGGFIPWDDDIDVGMLSSDYYQFKRIAKLELPQDVFFQDEDDMHNMCPCGKLRDQKSFFFNGNGSERKYYGIPIDIFIYEKMPNLPGLIVSLLVMFRRGSYRRWYSLLNRQRRLVVLHVCDLVGAIWWRFIHLVSVLAWKALAFMLKSECVHITPETGFSDCRKLNDIFPLTTHVFEGEMLPVPVGWAKYLTRMYGDWRRIPPEKERPSHSEFVIPVLEDIFAGIECAS